MTEESRNKEERIPIPQAKSNDRNELKKFCQALETTPDSPDLLSTALELLDGFSPDDVNKCQAPITNSAFSGTITLVNKSKPSIVHSTALEVIELLRIPCSDSIILSQLFENLGRDLEYLDIKTQGYIINILKNTIDSTSQDNLAKTQKIFNLTCQIGQILFKQFQKPLHELPDFIFTHSISILQIITRSLLWKGTEQISIPTLMITEISKILTMQLNQPNICAQQLFITLKHKAINIMSLRPKMFNIPENTVANLLITLLNEVSQSSFTQFFEIFNDIPALFTKYPPDALTIQNLRRLIPLITKRSGIYLEESNYYAKFMNQIIKMDSDATLENSYISYAISLLHSTEFKIQERLKLFQTLTTKLKPVTTTTEQFTHLIRQILFDFIDEFYDTVDQLEKTEFENFDLQYSSDVQAIGESFLSYIDIIKIFFKLPDSSNPIYEYQYQGRIQEVSDFTQTISKCIEFIHKYEKCYKKVLQFAQTPIHSPEKDRKLTQALWTAAVQANKDCEKVQRAYNSMVQLLFTKIFEVVQKGMLRSIWDLYFKTIFSKTPIIDFDQNIAKLYLLSPDLFAVLLTSFCTSINVIRSGKNLIEILKYIQNFLDTLTNISKPTQRPIITKLIPKFLSLIKNYTFTYSTYKYSIKVIESLFKFMTTLGIENKFVKEQKIVTGILNPILAFGSISISILDFISYCGNSNPIFYSFPVVTDVVILATSTNIEKSVELLGEIHKNQPKQLQRSEIVSNLLNILVNQLENMHGRTKNISLKIIRDIYPLAELNEEFKFPDSSSIIEISNQTKKIPIDYSTLLKSSLKSLLEDANNKVAQNLILNLVKTNFQSDHFTQNYREQLAGLCIHPFTTLKDRIDVFENILLQILEEFPDNPIVQAHVLISSYQSKPFDSIHKRISLKINSKEKFVTFSNEIIYIIDLKYYNISIVIKQVLKFIRHMINEENIDVLSYANIIATIAPEMTKDEPNLSKKQTNLQELNVFRSWFCKSIIHCHNLYLKNPKNLTEILNSIKNSSEYIVIWIYGEVIYNSEITPDILQFYNECLENMKNDISQVKFSRRLGIILRCFPNLISQNLSLFKEFCEKINKLNLVECALNILPPLIDNKIYNMSINLVAILKSIDARAPIFVRIPAIQIVKNLYQNCQQYTSLIDNYINQTWDALMQKPEIIVKLPVINTSNLHQLSELFSEIIPEKITSLFVQIFGNCLANAKTIRNDQNNMTDVISAVSNVLKTFTSSFFVFNYLKNKNQLIQAIYSIVNLFEGISLMTNMTNNRCVATFINRDPVYFFKMFLQEKEVHFTSLLNLIISEKRMRKFRELVVENADHVLAGSNNPEIISIVCQSLAEKSDKNVDKTLLQRIQSEIEKFSTNFQTFNDLTFKCILKHFSLSNLSLFLEISQQVFQLKNSYLVNLVTREFIYILNRQNFDFESFYNFEVNDEIIRHFILLFSFNFVKKYPQKLTEYLDKITDNMGIYGQARFMVLLFDKKVQIPDLQNRILSLFESSKSDNEKISVLSLWSRSPPLEKFCEIFKVYMTYLMSLTTTELNEIFKNLKIPLEADYKSIINSLQNTADQTRGNYKLTWFYLQIISNNMEFFGSHMDDLYKYLLETALVFTSIKSYQRLNHYIRYCPYLSSILIENSNLPVEKRGILTRYTLHILKFAFDLVSSNQDYFRLLGPEVFPSIEKLCKSFDLPQYFPDTIFDNLKNMYSKIQTYNPNQMQTLNQMQQQQRTQELMIFDTYLATLKNVLSSYATNPNFKLNENVVPFLVELSNHSSARIWMNACYALQNISILPIVTEKLVEIWPTLKDRQNERIFNIIWPTKQSRSIRYSSLMKQFMEILENTEWFTFPSLFANVSTMMFSMLTKTTEQTITNLVNLVDKTIKDLSSQKNRCICFLIVSYLLTLPTKYSSYVYHLFNDEKFISEYFNSLPKCLIDQIMNDKLKQNLINHLDNLQSSDLQKTLISYQIENQSSPLILSAKILQNILTTKSDNYTLLDSYRVCRFFSKSDLGLILKHSLNDYDKTELICDMKRGISICQGILGDWTEYDFTKTSDYLDQNKLIIEEPLINLRHFYYDRSLSSIPNYPKIASEVCSGLLKSQDLHVFKICMEYLYGDGLSLQSVEKSTKGLSKKVSEFVTNESLPEYLVFRELRRLCKSSNKLSNFDFWYKFPTGSNLILQQKYKEMRENLIQMANNNAQVTNLYKSDIILRRRLNKTLLSHLSSEMKQVRYSELSASSMIYYILSSNDKNDEIIKNCQKLIEKCLVNNAKSDAAFLAFYSLIEKLTDVEIKDVLTTAQIPFIWSQILFEKVSKLTSPEQYLQYFHNGFRFLFPVNGINIQEENSMNTKIMLENVIKVLIEKVTFSESDQLILRYNLQNTFCPMYEFSDGTVNRLFLSFENQKIKLTLLLNNGKKINFIVSKEKISDAKNVTFSRLISKVFCQSPGSFSRKQNIAAFDTYQISDGFYLTKTNCDTFHDLSLLPNEKCGFNGKKEYFEWFTLFGYRFSALISLHFARDSKFNSEKSMIDMKHCSIVSPSFCEKHKFVFELKGIYRTIMTSQGLNGPFRAGFISAIDAVMYKMAKFMATGISFFGDDDDKSQEIEERVKSVSLRNATNTEEVTQIQERVNKLIQSVKII
ncbi:hypothetical protein TVAG_446790 [Trichomonas vaginalis G3]|uniref:Uncharacterized protein n=1 Tax=Trichomonas vaginalis (strain ATCC PRA-98 / G3) TaxID=412133 RepID=A2E8N8_TRIV3|nr:hypothetical protein TVAGG3_0343800 [Trichomonas vaginalis G3]EAY10977.1 hypothetical protein TVAG_446790 [Trichomonas vaginalis G3]KAI5530822.1 hypothetical protein TVAGG3_0343800 [Trichomonas vaginalis G3]|eukprot:XP_001323200.1 hypothetical protein [Trichomonas vaginalis G3]